MEEIWKDIEGYEGLYQVSNLGRVKSLSRVVVRSSTRKYISNEKLLKLCSDKAGYMIVCLSKEGTHQTLKVHRLVANAFIPNPNEKKEVNHINGIKWDNRLENLEWNTTSENQKHAYSIGLNKGANGQRHGMSKLTDSQVKLIKLELGIVKSGELAKKYNVSQATISYIKSGKWWKHI